MRVLLVDDQGLFLEGLRHLLTVHGLDVVGTAGDGLEALAKARELRPDVILMDLKMPRCGGLEATRLILAEMPDVKIVILTVAEEDDRLFEAVRSGASGYLLKQSDAKEFLGLLTRLNQNEPPLSPGMASKILKEFAKQGTSPGEASPAIVPDTEKLSARQVSILALASRGLSYKEIATTLCISEPTVKYHIRQAIERLKLENRAQAIAYVRRTGMLKDE